MDMNEEGSWKNKRTRREEERIEQEEHNYDIEEDWDEYESDWSQVFILYNIYHMECHK